MMSPASDTAFSPCDDMPYSISSPSRPCKLRSPSTMKRKNGHRSPHISKYHARRFAVIQIKHRRRQYMRKSHTRHTRGLASFACSSAISRMLAHAETAPCQAMMRVIAGFARPCSRDAARANDTQRPIIVRFLDDTLLNEAFAKLSEYFVLGTSSRL